MAKDKYNNQKIHTVLVIVIIAMVVMISSSAAIVLAVVSSVKKSESLFSVEFFRDRAVHASIEGSSYLVKDGQEVKIEDIEMIRFSGDNGESNKVANFDEKISDFYSRSNFNAMFGIVW